MGQQMITALILLPAYYNPDEGGMRERIEDEKFIVTAEEISEEFGGGSIHAHRDSPVRGFGGTKVLSKET